MNLKQFKNLIESSDDPKITLNEDVVYEEIFDDFCENDDEIIINISRDLVIDGNGHAIDVKLNEYNMEIDKSNITFRDIHFKDNCLIRFSGKDSTISIAECEFTGSFILNQIRTLMNIEDCVFQKDTQIHSFGCVVMKNTTYRNNLTHKDYFRDMIEVNDIIIENCNFENNSHITIRRNGKIKDSTFKNNKSIRFTGDSLTVENTTFDGNNVIGLFYAFFYSNEHQMTLQNCIFKNNKAIHRGIIYSGGEGEININNCLFEDNFTEKGSIITKKEGRLNLENCSFKGDACDVIQCDCELNLKDCRFKKHHKINGENVFEISKKESAFLEKLR